MVSIVLNCTSLAFHTFSFPSACSVASSSTAFSNDKVYFHWVRSARSEEMCVPQPSDIMLGSKTARENRILEPWSGAHQWPNQGTWKPQICSFCTRLKILQCVTTALKTYCRLFSSADWAMETKSSSIDHNTYIFNQPSNVVNTFAALLLPTTSLISAFNNLLSANTLSF